jgi:5-(carboxyamino)imidazole ribonucleotide mutase
MFFESSPIISYINNNHNPQTTIIKMIQVGILMGSDSDWQKINGVAKALDEFGVLYEVNVMSAHRTPDLVKKYAEEAVERGILVIICAAGGAAHLAGTVAAHTTLPVIGIPVTTELSGGLDSLLSTVQMPGDIPVATVGVGAGGARNAGILAVQILALNNPILKQKLTDFRKGLVAKISEKNEKLKKSLE